MLHPRVGRDDEKAGEPRSQPHDDGRRHVERVRNAPAAVEQYAEEDGLDEECIHALDHQGRSDNRTGLRRERGPIGPELELHRYARDHT